jgi:hypothetical protein
MSGVILSDPTSKVATELDKQYKPISISFLASRLHVNEESLREFLVEMSQRYPEWLVLTDTKVGINRHDVSKLQWYLENNYSSLASMILALIALPFCFSGSNVVYFGVVLLIFAWIGIPIITGFVNASVVAFIRRCFKNKPRS